MPKVYTSITVEEAAKLLRRSKKTLQNAISSGKIPKDWYFRDVLGRRMFRKEKIIY